MRAGTLALMAPGTESASPVYDRIGAGYGDQRRPDPRWDQAIRTALGDARSVVNVGAGTGSYEPTDRLVVAIEPSLTMIDQRPPTAAPAVRSVAEAIPVRDCAFDARWRSSPSTTGPTRPAASPN